MIANENDKKKRKKLSLNNKTPSRHRSTLRAGLRPGTPKAIEIPLPKKSVRRLIHNVESSDESSLEIGWDNNSPSPSSCAKRGKKGGNHQKSHVDISAILKKVGKKKEIVEDELVSKNSLKTWMQDDLAICTAPLDNSIKFSNRKSRCRSHVSKGAKSFNEQLRCFIEKVVQSDDSHQDCEDWSVDKRRSSNRIAAKKNAICSPSLLYESPDNGNSINWSDPDIFSNNAMIYDPHTDFSEKPNLKRSGRLIDDAKYEDYDTNNNENEQSNCSNDMNNLSLCKSLFVKDFSRVNRRMKDNINSIESQVDKGEGEISMNQNLVNQRANELMQVDFDDDELDHLLSTQPLILLDSTKTQQMNTFAVTEEVAGQKRSASGSPESNLLSDIENKCPDVTELSSNKNCKDSSCVKDKFSINKSIKQLPITSTISKSSNKIETSYEYTPKRKKKTFDLIGFDDDDVFDSILINMDENVKCKSQETPPSINCGQRTLMMRCHTSPFPLGSKRTLIETECLPTNESINVKRNENISSYDNNENVNASSSEQKRCRQEVSKGTCKIDNKNYINQKRFAFIRKAEHCKLPQASNGDEDGKSSEKKQIDDNKLQLDFSIIGPRKNDVEEDSDICIPNRVESKVSGPFTSTQKCSFSEIQRKREEAQIKLKQRLKGKN